MMQTQINNLNLLPRRLWPRGCAALLSVAPLTSCPSTLHHPYPTSPWGCLPLLQPLLLPTWGGNCCQAVFKCEMVYVEFIVCAYLFKNSLHPPCCPSFLGDLSPAGWRSAASPLPQPSFHLRWPFDPLPGWGGSGDRRTWCTQSPAPTHGAHGAEPSSEPPGDRCEQ